MPVGGLVGHRVRFDDCSGTSTRILYATDGMLLREALADASLSAYGAIVLDEVHERSLATDVLLGVVKRAAEARPDLKIVAMSATLEASKLLAYFPNAKAARVLGRTFPVDLHYAAVPVPGYLDASIATTLAIATDQRDKEGDLLVFLTGREEIEAACRLVQVRERAKEQQEKNKEKGKGGGKSKENGSEPYANDGKNGIGTKERNEGNATVDANERNARNSIVDAPATFPSPAAASSSAGSLSNRPPLRLLALPLYASLPPDAQRRAFEPAPAGFRKVVFATNVAETSLTVPGVSHVIDCGLAKIKAYSASLAADRLSVSPISKAAAAQRMGRAGRERPGTCYRLYTEASYEALQASTVPEILRTDLASSALQLKAMGIDNVLGFDFLDKPSPVAFARGLQHLLALGALDGAGRLTDKGRLMARLPVEPPAASSLLAAMRERCPAEACDAVALLDGDEIWVQPREKREEAARAHARWKSESGDAVAAVSAFRAWLAAGGPTPAGAAWATEAFLSHRALRRAYDVSKQLREHLDRIAAEQAQGPGGKDGEAGKKKAEAGASPAPPAPPASGRGNKGSRPSSRGRAASPLVAALAPGPHVAAWPPPSEDEAASTAPLRRALCAGLFARAARRAPESRTYRVLASKQDVAIHPGSCLAGGKSLPEAVVFAELVVTSRAYARGVTAIEPAWLPELAPVLFASSQG